MRLSLAAATDLVVRILDKQAVPADIARDVAEHLVESDRVGYASHGISILPGYARALTDGQLLGAARPTLETDGGVFQAWHGRHGFGQHVGKQVIAAGIEAARAHGQCIVTLRDSHHLGRMGSYGEQAVSAGMVLIAFTNVINRPPMVAPFGGAEARLTTNPICFASPLPDGRPPLILDMATSTIALNKARVLADNGDPAPDGALIDADGLPTSDPSVMFANPPGALLPFGGHKGYALGVIAELLAGVLSGGGTIQPEHPREGLATNNMFAVIFDPSRAGAASWQGHEAGAFIDYLLSCPPQPGTNAVQYPGEYEARNRLKNSTHIALGDGSWKALSALADSLGVAITGEAT
ncbi:Ldh family oxidoreductase [Variovorax sp. RHLX14]|uniref:Ldh family oxidoreductase n=1 Tax=Variovorax sp. RHLX14 TaxID=1259731 RepID=UPI003F47A602